MIQIIPNELHVKILKYVATEMNFEKFCTLRTVCKKWNTFIPLIMHEDVISKLSSGFKFMLTYDEWNKTEWSEEFSPTYCDSTKSFTFLFDQTEDITISHYYQDKPKEYYLIAYVKNGENSLVPLELGAKFKGLDSPQRINNDIYKYEFDRQSNLRFKQEIEEGNVVNHLRLYSFTIASWELCYILDCLAQNR
ncbi:21453_t:CDS:2, partial [Cetraspora pellucida]